MRAPIPRRPYDVHVLEAEREVRTLKQSPAREVRLERPRSTDASGAGPRVVKRFESAGLFAARRDAARARREHEMLEHLSARGLSVPRPLGLSRDGAAWEVAMEWIPAAVTLEALLRGLAPWPVDPALLARRLGGLLAGLHAAGVDHPDLHPGNVLIDGSGRVWAIDFHKARLFARLSPTQLEAHLARLAAGTRERAPTAFRLRFLSAWRRAYGPGKRFSREELAALVARLDARARREREAAVEKRRLRWTRAGTAVRAVALEAGDGFERADREPGLARSLEAALEREGGQERRRVLRLPGERERRVLVVSGAAWRPIAAAWYCAARLEEHALEAARPLAIARGKRPWAAFELPAWGHAPEGWTELGQPACLHALGALGARLFDRGLELTQLEPSHLWTDGRARVLPALTSRLARSLELGPQRFLERWQRTLAPAIDGDAARREALEAGFGSVPGAARVPAPE